MWIWLWIEYYIFGKRKNVDNELYNKEDGNPIFNSCVAKVSTGRWFNSLSVRGTWKHTYSLLFKRLCFFFFFLFLKIGWTQTHSVAEDGLELLFTLPLPPKS